MKSTDKESIEMLRKLITLQKNHGKLIISLLEKDGLITLNDALDNTISIMAKQEDEDTVIVGHMNK